MNDTPLHPTLPAPDPRILPAVWKLLGLRVRLTFNGFRHAKLRRKIGMVALWLMILGIAFAESTAIYALAIALIILFV